MTPPATLPGRPFPLGATPDQGRTNVAVTAETADRVQLCRFDATAHW